MRTQLLSFSCLLLSSAILPLVTASCYYPDGDFPTDYVYVPCSGDEFTSCCILSEGDQCLSNGLCYDPSGQYMFRSGCSDKNWNSPNCFQHCKNTTNYYSDSYERIVECGGDRYCCYSDGNICCNDDSKVFSLGSATVIKDLATTRTSGVSIATPSIATRSAAGSTTPASVGSSPTSSSTSSGSNNQSNSTSHNFSKTTIIVVSVVGLLIFVVVIALSWFCIRRHYRRKMQGGGKEQSFPLSSKDGFQKLPDKSPRPVEVPAPLHSPAPPYQPPAYQTSPYISNGAVEIENSYRPPQTNQWGQPVSKPQRSLTDIFEEGTI